MEYYQTKRYLNNRCVRCGNVDENTLAGKTKCIECTAIMARQKKERREYRKANHQCVDCGRKDSRTLSGKTRCFMCSATENECARRYREKKKLLHK